MRRHHAGDLIQIVPGNGQLGVKLSDSRKQNIAGFERRVFSKFQMNLVVQFRQINLFEIGLMVVFVRELNVFAISVEIRFATTDLRKTAILLRGGSSTITISVKTVDGRIAESDLFEIGQFDRHFAKLEKKSAEKCQSVM
jgi:hypothetical protein